MSWRTMCQGLRRPLPPVQSREAVLVEAGSANDWVSVDDSGDVLISLPPKRLKLNNGSVHQTGNSTYLSIQGLPRKRRMFNSAQIGATPQHDRPLAEEIQSSSRFSVDIDCRKPTRINKFELQPSSLPDRSVIAMVYDVDSVREEAMPCDHVSYGEATIINSGDDVQREARRLAIMTSQNSTGPGEEHVATEKQVEQNEPQHIDEDALAKSRELRRKALARRAFDSLSHEQIPRIDAGQLFEREPSVETANATVTCATESRAQPRKSPTIPDQSPLSRHHTESPDIDELFDVAHEAARGDSNTGAHDIQTNTSPPDLVKGLHPASRAAAERYRTQNRHLPRSVQSPSCDEGLFLNPAEGEGRLKQLTSRKFGGESTLRTHFLGYDANNTRQLPSVPSNPQTIVGSQSSCLPEAVRDQSPSEAHQTPFSAAPTDRESRHRAFPTQVDENDVASSEPGRTSSSFESPAHLPYAATPSSWPSTNPKRAFKALDNVVSYPAQGDDLRLPKDFPNFSDDRKQIIIEHEIEKERHRDLEAILAVFRQAAIFGTVDEFTDRESKEIKFIQEFAKMVIDHGLSGKRMRKRVTDVRDNMRRRVQRRAPEEMPDHQSLLDKMLKPERRQHVEQMIADAEERMKKLSILRSQAHSGKPKRPPEASVIGKDSQGRQALKDRKRTRLVSNMSLSSNDPYADLPDGAVVEFGTHGQMQSAVNATERRRLAQYAVADRKAARLRAALARFDEGAQDASPPRDVATWQHEEVSDISSEEEEGAEFYTSFDATRPLQDPRSHADACSDTEKSQHARHHQCNNEALAASMRQTERQRSILNEQSTQRPDYYLSSVNNEKAIQQNGESETFLNPKAVVDFIDGHDGVSDDDERICYRYTMKSQSCGIPEYDDDYEIEHGSFLNHKTAETHLDALIRELIERYYDSQSVGRGTHQQHSRHDDGQSETVVEFGKDSEAYLRIWIERSEHCPSGVEYQNAKVRRACRAKTVYTVLWERVVTPIEPTHEAEDDDDDLFGPDDPLPITEATASSLINNGTSIPQITRVQWEPLRLFTTIAAANRHAKDVFMRWFMDHLRGSENFGYILLEEQSVEDQLESYGNTTMWEREEEFDVYEDSGDIDEDTVGERRLIENDRFRVWVTEKDVSGPAN